jgi:rfaE bifunctional protein nucleotidyltransferase chain/domain
MNLGAKIFNSVADAKSILESYKSAGRKLVFTNGCFDLIHIGHVLYLEEARNLGDILIVGVNSDASITRLKGPNRPINDLNARMHVLAGLESVSMVIPFDHDTPYDLIKSIIPNVLVKGGDWRPDQIVGSDVVLANAGVVKTLRFIEGYSTTGIEKKIRG